MTANELADELDKMIPVLPLTVLIKSATMLRLQQAEIEKLKLQLEYMFKQEIKNAEVIK
tara:strand:+ start:638 stop:814 length:177 start_codon:yes stop_codon:yes gene_type:complete